MIQLTYQELYRISPLEATKILLQTFKKTGGNLLRTAKELGCSRNTVKKFVRRQEMGLPLEDLSRRPKRSPCQTAKEIGEIVVGERKATKTSDVLAAPGWPTISGRSMALHFPPSPSAIS